MNPSPHTREHSLALDGAIHLPDRDVVRETAPLYRLSASEAEAMVEEARAAVSRWRLEAADAGLPQDEIDLLAAAFEPA